MRAGALIVVVLMLAGLSGGAAAAPCAPPYCAVSSSITDAPSAVTATSATLNGAVVPNGSPARYHFELTGGPPPSSYTSTEGTLPGDDQRHPVSVDVSGLQPDTTYSYRIVSTNDSGAQASGATVSFTTPAQPKPPTAPTSFTSPSSVPVVRGRTLRLGRRGNDCLTFLSTPNSVLAGAGNDTVLTGDFDDVVRGGPGNDRLALGKGQDEAYGEGGNDRIYGDGQSIPSCRSLRIRARAAMRKLPTIWNDRLDGGPGDDRVYGQAGDDRITGGTGHDLLEGGVGNDRIYARDGQRDTIVCGAGRDVVRADRIDKVARDCETVVRPAT